MVRNLNPQLRSIPQVKGFALIGILECLPPARRAYASEIIVGKWVLASGSERIME
jgi:hypothetical protein